MSLSREPAACAAGAPNKALIDVLYPQPGAVFEFPEIQVSSIRDHTALLSRDDFQGILVIKIDGQLDILRSIRTQRLEEQLEDIIKMLEHELAS